MKRVILSMILAGCLAGCSTGKIEESYSGPSIHAKSVGEGQHTYSYTYHGKNFIAVLGNDGKYHTQGETK